MAEELDEVEAGRLMANRYEFDQWLNGSWWKLTQGVDFHRPVEKMRTYAFAQAKKRGLRLTTKASGETLWIMAITPGQKAQGKVSSGEISQDPASLGRGRPSKYPEEMWDGKPRAFYPGKDFQEGCQEGFRQAVRAAATYRGVSIKTSARKDGSVVIQAVVKATT